MPFLLKQFYFVKVEFDSPEFTFYSTVSLGPVCHFKLNKEFKFNCLFESLEDKFVEIVTQ